MLLTKALILVVVFFSFQRFAALCFNFLDAIDHWKFFGHRSAEFFDRLANFRTHFFMCLIRSCFSFDIFAAKLIFGLRCAEEIGRQFGAAHVVENALTFFQTFAPMNVAHFKAVIKTHVAVVLENGIIDRFDDASLLGGSREFDVMEFHLLAQKKPPLFFCRLIRQLLTACLNCEVSLSESNNFLPRVSVLNNQITGIS